MNMTKKWIVPVAGCLAVLASAKQPAVAKAMADKPNVVLIYADDFGWGDLRCHNDRPEHFRYTPNLDRMFSEGIELKNYMTHAVCSPSRAGLLTGRHYANVGAGPRTGGTLPNDIRNMAKDFQSAGYKTGAFGKWHNSLPNFPEDGNGKRVDYNKVAKFNELYGEKTLDLNNNIFENHKGWKWGEGVNAYGFDRWVGFYAGGGDHWTHYVDWHHDADWWHDRKYRADERGYRTDLITTHATAFIEQNKDRPFFCYVPQEAVHSPIQLKRSDLIEFCEKLESELGIKGQWDYVSDIVSPKSGRRLGDVEKMRFDRRGEFKLSSIDPKNEHFSPLIYAAYVYTLDKSIGTLVKTLEDTGLAENTIIVFASDNGATPEGINLPFKGKKHTLWDGGVHVPAAIWWPGTFDRNSKYYAKNNQFEGMISYLDLYPTLLAMSGNPCLAKGIDGKNCWSNLQMDTEPRPDSIDDAEFWMWLDHGMVRTSKWKLFYSESTGRIELYDLEADIAEKKNVSAANPEVTQALVKRYREWINNNNYAMSWMTIPKENISHPDPAPVGEVLEVTAVQIAPIKNPDRDGVFVRLSNGIGWEEEYDAYIHADDRIEFDIFVCEDSDVMQGCYYNPGNGWNPFYTDRNGLNQDGIPVSKVELPKGKWTRQVVGIGNYCPGTIPVNYIALQHKQPATYHYYLDNVVVRKKDGGIRSVIWQSEKNFAPIIYRYKKQNHNSFEKARAVDGFPFESISVSVLNK